MGRIKLKERRKTAIGCGCFEFCKGCTRSRRGLKKCEKILAGYEKNPEVAVERYKSYLDVVEKRDFNNTTTSVGAIKLTDEQKKCLNAIYQDAMTLLVKADPKGLYDYITSKHKGDNKR